MLLLEWELFPSPWLLCISILLSLSSSGWVIHWTFYIAVGLVFFSFPCYPILWNPWLPLSTAQKVTPDCWQVASMLSVHCCWGQAVSVLLHANCCFLGNSCCSLGMSVCMHTCAYLGCKNVFSWAKYFLIWIHQKLYSSALASTQQILCWSVQD